jgi:hypothetical protein
VKGKEERGEFCNAQAGRRCGGTPPKQDEGPKLAASASPICLLHDARNLKLPIHPSSFYFNSPKYATIIFILSFLPTKKKSLRW